MSIDPTRLEALAAEMKTAQELPPYHAVNGLGVSQVKLAHLLPTIGGEHEQVASLLRRFTREQVASVLSEPGIDRLLELDPPLETVLGNQQEQLSSISATKQVASIRERRFRDPKPALAALFEILQRIRDKKGAWL